VGVCFPLCMFAVKINVKNALEQTNYALFESESEWKIDAGSKKFAEGEP
jgi:hypothetical protein